MHGCPYLVHLPLNCDRKTLSDKGIALMQGHQRDETALVGTTFGFRGGNLGGTGGFAAAAQRGGGFGGSQAAAGFGSTAPGALSSTTTTGDKWAPRR